MKKKAILLAILFLSTISAAWAQVADGRVGIENIDARREGEFVRVTYNAVIDPKAVKRDYSLLFTPVIVGEGFRQSLPAVLVHGRGSAIARQRRELAFGTTAGYDEATVAASGTKMAMSTLVPFQQWMNDANIVFESIEAGCCSMGELQDAVVARGILPSPMPEPKPIPIPEPEWVPVSVGDSLSTAFQFVLPFSEFDPEDPFRIYDDERDNGLIIYYPVAKYYIDPDYMENSYSLNNLVSSVSMIVNSNDSKLAKIVVAGFASPEGSLAFNDKLAFERAVSLKKYLVNNAGIAEGDVLLFNGSVDWRGLRARIARGTLPERKALLDLIDNTPVYGENGRPGRFEALRRMNGGSTYRYLLAEHFPYLRSGAFIKVFYENKITH
jgi:outer membrane protein OmpA-like peptidoglycan-associated protein